MKNILKRWFKKNNRYTLPLFFISLFLALFLLYYIKSSLLFILPFTIIIFFTIYNKGNKYEYERFFVLILPLFLISILYISEPITSENYVLSSSWEIQENSTRLVVTEITQSLDGEGLLSNRVQLTTMFGKISSIPSYTACVNISKLTEDIVFEYFFSEAYFNNNLVIPRIYLDNPYPECFDFIPDYKNEITFKFNFKVNEDSINLSKNNYSDLTKDSSASEPFQYNIKIIPKRVGVLISLVIFLLSYYATVWLITRMWILYTQGIK